MSKKSAAAVAEAPDKAKSKCPISRAQFAKGAKPLTITVNGAPMAAGVKEFSTGSIGWYLNGKTVVEIDGVPVNVQVGLNLTVVGSKDLPK